MSAAENLRREDLSAIEEVEAIVEFVDAEPIGDKEYALMHTKGDILLSTCQEKSERRIKSPG